jgi:hypothetical protein
MQQTLLCPRVRPPPTPTPPGGRMRLAAIYEFMFVVNVSGGILGYMGLLKWCVVTAAGAGAGAGAGTASTVVAVAAAAAAAVLTQALSAVSRMRCVVRLDRGGWAGVTGEEFFHDNFLYILGWWWWV